MTLGKRKVGESGGLPEKFLKLGQVVDIELATLERGTTSDVFDDVVCRELHLLDTSVHFGGGTKELGHLDEIFALPVKTTEC